MPVVAELQRIDFGTPELQRVQSFACGSEVWSKFAEDWIKNAPPFPSALTSIQERQTLVWLYLLNDALVGFASLGPTTWNRVPPDGRRRELWYIPQMAVCSDFHGQPANGDTFASQILNDVLAEAQSRDIRPVALLVDSENVKAQRFYQRHQFAYIEGNIVRHERTFLRMLYDPA